jgi:hypothetical protein
MICTLSTTLHRSTQKHLRWHSITKILRNGPRAHFPFNIPIERLNYGVITLLPKFDNTIEMKSFRPICLLNVCYKIITKVLNNRLSCCIKKVINDSQSGFIRGRFILDSVVALHEILHEVKRDKQNDILLKIDFEKAYDKVNWQFLYQMMITKGFGTKWCDWVMRIVRGGRVAIRTNDLMGPFFSAHKGVRQGDPFSPLLFNLAADGLSNLVRKAQQEGLVTGLIPHIVNWGVVNLQYADDVSSCYKMT